MAVDNTARGLAGKALSAGLADGSVTYAKIQNVSATNRLLGRVTADAGVVEELTGAQATSLLSAVVGDSGSGGTKGLVPAPASGDAAAGKFLKADGTWATAGGGVIGNVPLVTLTASTSATLSDTTNITSAYDAYEIVFENVKAASPSANLTMQVTVDGGANWKAGASEYFAQVSHATGGTQTSVQTGSTSMKLTEGGSTDSIGVTGRLLFLNPNAVSAHKQMIWHIVYSSPTILTGSGVLTDTSLIINGIRFLESTGNIASGKIHINGIKFA